MKVELFTMVGDTTAELKIGTGRNAFSQCIEFVGFSEDGKQIVAGLIALRDMDELCKAWQKVRVKPTPRRAAPAKRKAAKR